MYKNHFFLILFGLFLIAASSVGEAAIVKWTNGSGNRQWSTPSNWDLNRLPSADYIDDATIVKTGTNGPIFDTNDSPQSAWFIVVGYQFNNGELWIKGGTLTAPWGLALNKSAYSALNSTVHMSGGLLNLTGSSGVLHIGRGYTATFNMTGGTIDCKSFEIPSEIYSYEYTTGAFNLGGGVVNADSLFIAVQGPSQTRSGRLNITKGKLILTGDKRTTVNGYINDGVICAYPGYTGRRMVNVDYDVRNPGKTTVTAARTEPNQAWNPKPMDTHPGVDEPVTLSWSPGDGAVSHELYLGMDFNDVNDGMVDSIITDVNNYTPNALILGQTYYWRVDEVSDVTTKGVVWSFTVAYNPLASDPQPGDGVKGVDPNVVLFWSAGDEAILHDVYLGTSYSDVNSASNPNVLPGRGRQGATSYDPETLLLDQKYYWRIDEFDGSVVHRGDIWSFEVVSSFASQPSPHNGATYVSGDAVLSWLSGYGAVSHDVYLGTSFNDVNSSESPTVVTITNSYNPGGLGLSQAYYWRIDEFDGAIKHRGQVWNFTTEPVGSVRAFPGAEGYGAYSRGGRGGDVYHVTSLTDNVNNPWYDPCNPLHGSLRYGINSATGPRTIVFDVSGYIDLAYRLEINKSYLTIAGQTAPGNGITLRKHDIRVYDANNIIIRYLRIRTGHYEEGQYESPQGYPDLDALSVEGCTDSILDHISASWSKDECMSVVGDSNDVTVQWCIMAEPLTINSHAESSLLRPAMSSRLSHHHNLYSDVVTRVTRFGNYNDDVTTRFNWYNNVVFNWGTESTYSNDAYGLWNYVDRIGSRTGSIDGEFVELNLMDNYFVAGPGTLWYKAYLGGSATNHKLWAAGNLMDSDMDTNRDGIDTGWDMITGYYTKMGGAFTIEAPYTWESAQSAYGRVLAEAGASYVRDAADERIINEVRMCTGIIPVTQNDVGGWPEIAEIHRPANFDTDDDGMPNAWELPRGFDPNNASDGALDADADGYTNLEEYLNFLAQRGGEMMGDLDDDGDVDWADLATFSEHWLDSDCDDVPVGNLNYDCRVDFRDFAIFAQNWSE